MTEATQSTPELPVIQADRNRLAARYRELSQPGMADEIVAGEQDDHPTLIMLARHRIEHSTPDRKAVLESLQSGVDKWMDACFGEPIKSDQLERADRFIEEALELAQTMPGFTKNRAHALVDYVFDRPQGDINQEVGGVMITLAALCNVTGVSIDEAASTELARIWTKVEQIRAKQAAKPTGSALPIATTPEPKP